MGIVRGDAADEGYETGEKYCCHIPLTIRSRCDGQRRSGLNFSGSIGGSTGVVGVVGVLVGAIVVIRLPPANSNVLSRVSLGRLTQQS